MALVKADAVQRIEVHDGWIDVRATPTVGHVMEWAGTDELAVLANPTAEIFHRMLVGMIVAWSYDEPVTPDNIKRLDMDATTSIIAFTQGQLGMDQKKGRRNGTR